MTTPQLTRMIALEPRLPNFALVCNAATAFSGIFGGGVHGTMPLFSPDYEAEQSSENFKRLPFAVA